MTTFTTTITTMYTVPNPTGYVVNVLFRVTGVDGDYTAYIDGNITYTPEQSEPGFVPYDQLTQTEVIGWIPESDITNAQECVQNQINSMITPPVSPSSQPLPWVA
jgi:hypothetical protein